MNHSCANEAPVLFECENETLIGIINKPDAYSETALLIIVGGPQYRVGSHRQFVELARSVSANGIASMRFDYRGMGDSDGEIRDFLSIEEDIKCAIDVVFEKCSRVNKVVLWGLCDAATAASYYCVSDERVGGLVLLNPWVRENIAQVSSETLLKHYYLKKILSLDEWKKALLSDSNNILKLGELLQHIKKVALDKYKAADKNTAKNLNNLTLAERILISLDKYCEGVLVITSEKDLTAKEFLDGVIKDKIWGSIFNRENFEHVSIPDADHTLTDKSWKRQVEDATTRFINTC